MSEIETSEKMGEVKDLIVDPLNEGRTSFLHGRKPNNNPYKQDGVENSTKHMAWWMGFMEALYIHQVTLGETRDKKDE